MTFQNKFTKKIAFILLISMLSLNLSFLTAPQRAQATGLPVMDFTVMWKEYLKPYIVTPIIKKAAKQLILRVTQATVDWINNGFNGNPAYVADLNKFLLGEGGVADRAVGDFFSDTALGFLCDPFKIQVQLALQLGYGAGLRDRLGCTFTKIEQNISNAQIIGGVNLSANGASVSGQVSKFASQGGWNQWLTETLQPQNSPQGAYLIAKEAMDAKITDAKGNTVADLNFGQGALSFKRCTDKYYDGNGNLKWTSEEYTEGSQRPTVPAQYVEQNNSANKATISNINNSNLLNGGGSLDLGISPTSPAPTKNNNLFTQNSNQPKTTQDCTVKTPGSAITGMLTQKATTDVRQSELTATLADGIDAIFSALVNAMIKKAMNQLNKGVLDNDKTDYNNYNTALDGALTSAINQGNDLINGVRTPETLVLPDTPIIPPLYPSASTTATTTPSVNGIGAFDVLGQAKNNAKTLIDSFLKSEKTYQNNYLIVLNLLTETRKTFASTSVCNVNANRTDSTLRASLIKSNVISNIDGIEDPERSVASITSWDFKAIDTAIKSSNAHIIVLNKGVSDVGSASNITAVKDAMIPINSTSFNSDVQPKLVENVKTWVIGISGMYNSKICPIDLNSLLKINSATSTTK